MQNHSEDRSLYEVSHWEIFSKNFLVGFARALGGIFVQFIFFVVLYFIFIQFLSPILSPMFALMERSVNAVESVKEQQNKLQNIFPFGTTKKEIDQTAPVQTR